MLVKVENLIKNLKVYPENMEANLKRYGDLVYSEGVLLELVEKGLTREKAYELVQRNAMEAWKGKQGFKELLSADTEVRAYLSPQEIDELCRLQRSLRHVDFIFQRIFGGVE